MAGGHASTISSFERNGLPRVTSLAKAHEAVEPREGGPAVVERDDVVDGLRRDPAAQPITCLA